MSGAEYIKARAGALDELCRRFGVRRLTLFGSGLGPNWDPSASDLDLCAEFGDPPEGLSGFRQFFSFLLELEELLGVKVDVVERLAISRPWLISAIDKGLDVYVAA